MGTCSSYTSKLISVELDGFSFEIIISDEDSIFNENFTKGEMIKEISLFGIYRIILNKEWFLNLPDDDQKYKLMPTSFMRSIFVNGKNIKKRCYAIIPEIYYLNEINIT